ncbi:boophilin-H2-like isoform X3 [Dermacentor silvarum]|uniref:boophilin-H2-like isoform X3 n=1 Tax=Dermacentor silvarum TaxID=543639 RepID=UPI00210129C8|nr:boophilin-H2-like isoform X3 [Dermacentor silvarum]
MKAYVFLVILSTACALNVEQQCAGNADRGLCKLSLHRWWFNTNTGKCEQFYYGGCGGNHNRYDTKEVCEHTCANEKVRVEEMCRRPPHRGPCLANMHRFYYNHLTESCRPFVYGGCQSNGNNFQSYFDCMKVCKGSLLP